jgi:hypothetical protein
LNSLVQEGRALPISGFSAGGCSQNKRPPHRPCAGVTASEYFGQPYSVEILLRELHFFTDYIRDNRNTILNLQFFNLSISELLTKLDQTGAFFRNQLNDFPVDFGFTLANHDSPPRAKPCVKS